MITDTVVSAGNVGDAAVAADLIADLTHASQSTADAADTADTADAGDGSCPPAPAPVVYGDSAYGSSGQFLDALAVAGVESKCKTQPPTAAGGMFTKDQFVVDLDADTVTCPNQATAPIRRDKHGDGTASFGSTCADCPLRAQCTNATKGRSIRVGRYEQQLADARAAQKDPAWREDYRGTRPKVERKLGHLMHRKHGGRRARMIGQPKIDADFNLLATAHNLARLAVLGFQSTPKGWATAAA